jgi:hypothetical protein
MSEIRFIDAQGDLLDRAIAGACARRPATRMSRLGKLGRPHKRLMIVLVAIVVAGCAAVAATQLLGSSERLLLGRVDCYYGTNAKHGLDVGATLISGETPQSWCKQEFRSYTRADLREFGVTPVRNPALVACRKNATTIAVFITSGRANQCDHIGLTPLPPTFNAASASVHALAQKLRSIYVARDCWSAHGFANALRSALVQNGFANWRIVMPRPYRNPGDSPMGLGRCADFSSGSYLGNPYQALDGINRTLNLGFGIARSSMALVNRLSRELTADMWRSCYSRAGARALVARALAGTGLTPKFAITVNPNDPHNGPGFSFGSTAHNRHFQNGCVQQEEVWPALNAHVEYVWLIALHGRALQQAEDPPASYFHS